jgi:mannose-6-phosphate isomerase-like protein (cupin superfamily)
VDRIDIAEKFSRFSEHWRPKVVAEVNGQELKLVKVKGDFPWHHHDDEDELFLVWRGRFRIEFRDRIIDLGPGEACVVPRGVEHRTAADDEAERSWSSSRAPCATPAMSSTRFSQRRTA